MGKQIMLPPTKKKEIAKLFKTTRTTVWNALNYKTDSQFAKLLRAAAFERGGKLFEE